METRILQTDLTIREVPNQPIKLVGYAVYWNKPNVVIDRGRKYRESFKPGAFQFDDVFGLLAHDAHQVLSTRSGGTMTVEQKDDGLYFEMTMPNTTLGRDTIENVRVKNYRGASVGFNVVEDKWNFKDGPSVEIIKAELKEITITSIPAHPSSVSVREIPQIDLTEKRIRLYKINLPIS